MLYTICMIVNICMSLYSIINIYLHVEAFSVPPFPCAPTVFSVLALGLNAAIFFISACCSRCVGGPLPSNNCIHIYVYIHCICDNKT